MNARVLFFVILFEFSATAWCINFSRVNVAWQYDLNAEIRLNHRVVTEGGNLMVFLRIDADSTQKWKYTYLVQDGYESEDHREIEPLDMDTLALDQGVLLKLTFPKVEESLLVVRIAEFETFYYYDIPLKIGTLSPSPIYPVNERGVPILSKYINRSGFKWKGSDSFYAMQYPENFREADPPMADMKPLAPRADLDTSFVFYDTVRFEENYFYVVRADSNDVVGVTMLRTPPYFPEYRQLRELVEAMFYLTSEAERKSLINSKDTKRAFDSFWMNNFNTKARARAGIRKYYNWIEVANRLFTDFKPGWKTDRGMLLIVYGQPDEVYRTTSSEEWYYDSGEAFEFSIISSFFAAKTYNLRRNKDFEEGWYNHVAAIRRGINE
ncbi:MAG: hypothetical protein Tsb0034_05430 [Ekhidna sp.]